MGAAGRLLVATILCASAASADRSAGAEEAASPIAEGEQAFARGDYEEALEAFRAARAAGGVPALLYNIAMCLWELDRPAEAVNAFREYVEVDRAGLSEADLAEIERVLGELRPRHGDLVIEVSTAGATVAVDGEEVGTVPLGRPVAVAPGEHRVAVEAEGMAPAEVTRSVEAGATETVSLVLEPVAPETPAPPEEPVEEPPRGGVELGWWFWASTGLAAAAALGLAVTGGLALHYHGEYEDGGRLDVDAHEAGQALAVTTDALIGVASAAALAAVISLTLHFVLGPPRPGDAGAGGAATAWPTGGVAW